jgi:uncharacterized protein (TIGR02231 family)
VSVREWGEVAAYVGRETADATHELRKSELARRDLGRRIAQARADLAKVQAKRERTTKTVAIEVEAEQGGAFEVGLSYAVGAAGWQPVWDARLLTESSTMELSLEGSVWQRTGEDWNGVALTVSTSQPRGLFVPKLDPHYLTRHEPPRPEQYGAAEDKAAAPPAAAQAGLSRRHEKAAKPEESEEPEEQMDLASAGVEEGLLSASFTAPRRESVDGSGQARKVPLAHFPLRAEIVRTAAPRLEAATFLIAKAVNATGFPLLGGAASVYVGNEFAGRTRLPKTPPGGELELAFGADDRVEVDRKVLERRRESAGTFTKDEVYRYRVRVSVKNRYSSPVAVKLLDLIPVSRDEKIAVRLLDGSTAAAREDPERPGVRVYELALAAGEQKAVELRYEVRYPREFPIAGLE